MSKIQEFSDTEFDYIVIGGGTAGLTIASRLSENPSINVGVLEAGSLQENDPLIDVPRNLAMNNGDPKYDWVTSTSAQPGAAGRSMPVIRGRIVGGSSALNYMAWDRGSKEEYDMWGLVAGSDGGWNWDSLLPFLTTAENIPSPARPDAAIEFSTSSEHVVRPGLSSDLAVGTRGPVKTCHNIFNTDVVPPYVKAWNARNQNTNANPFGGHPNGLYSCRVSVDPETGKRITAAGAYYTPASTRTNLKLLTGAQVTKIIFNPELGSDGKRIAVGVEFTVEGGKYSASVSKEVVLSAGTIGTPAILELSGIGDAKLLAKMGVPSLVDVPGVGENLHDHIFTHAHFQAVPGIRTFDDLKKNPAFGAAEQERYEKTGQGWLAGNDTIVVFSPLNKLVDESTMSAKIHALEATLEAKKNQGSLSGLLAQQYSIQLEWLKQGNLPHLEFILFSAGVVKPDPEASYFMLATGVQHPFSRGSVHIQSADPLKQPVVNPCYLTEEFDMFSLLTGYREIERLAQTSPLADIIATQVLPSSTLSDEGLTQYIRQSCTSGSHYMGTASMAPLKLGGVVGTNLKVHGTANLRVADASIIPVPIAAHIQATVYAIGEKAAELIKMDNGN